MSRGGVVSSPSPTAWVYLSPGDCTIRWQRGDSVAYIFDGKQMETYPDVPLKVGIDVLATISVSSQGWTDLAEVTRVGESWVKAKRQRCRACGGIR